MKTLLVFLCLLISDYVYCQCNYWQDEIDEFTGTRILKTSRGVLLNKFGGQSFVCQAAKIDNHTILYMTFDAWSVFSISKGSKILFKLTNDSIYGLLSTSEYEISHSKNMQYVPNWETTIYCVLNEDDIKTLTEYGVKKCRIYTDKGYLEYEFNPNKTMVIKELINCVL